MVLLEGMLLLMNLKRLNVCVFFLLYVRDLLNLSEPQENLCRSNGVPFLVALATTNMQDM